MINYLLSDCVDYSDNPNIYEFIAEDMDDPGFDDTYFQSTNSDNQHLFAQSMAELVLMFRYKLLQKFINNITSFYYELLM